MVTRTLTLGEIAEHLGAQISVGNQSTLQAASSEELAAISISGLGALASAQPGELSHLSSPPLPLDLANTCRVAQCIRETVGVAAGQKEKTTSVDWNHAPNHRHLPSVVGVPT